jgi:hypothetical protein
MSRPPAQVIEKIQIGDFEYVIAATPANWELTRYNEPVYVIKQHWLQDRKTYPRTTFSNQAHAQNLADKLNLWFNTQAYTVRKTL